MKKFWSVVFVLFLTCGVVSAATQAELEQQIQQLNAEITRLDKQIETSAREGNQEQLKYFQQKYNAKVYRRNGLKRDLQAVKNRENIKKSFAEMEIRHINLLENLKTCKPTSAVKVLPGTHYILGYESGKCVYRIDLGSSSILCKFPSGVLKTYAEESIKSIKTGVASQYAEQAMERYCSYKK